MAAAVNDRSAAVEAMACEWPMLEALMAGTRAMRAGSEKFLPKWPGEDKLSYETRRDTATLFPAYRRTVAVMSGKPFAKALTLSDQAPAQIVEWAADIDREGVNLHGFAAEMFRESFYGLAGILVEAPKPPEVGDRPLSVAEERQAGMRPYFVRVMHGQILGWRSEVRQGSRVLTQLRLMEKSTEPDGEFGEATVERVRVLEPGSWRLFKKVAATPGAKEEWVLEDEGRTSLSYIPFVPVYGWRTGFMSGVSPLLDLAYLNVKHWQSQSDQDNILHVARVPILFAKGLGENPLTVGAGVAVKTEAEHGDLKFVEHTGAAIEAGANSLSALEDQMIQAGAELLVKKPGDRSATESANDAEANKSDLQRMVEMFEDSLDAALQMMADYANLGALPNDGLVSLFKDFGAANLTEASGQLVLAMQEAGLISRETAIAELKRRGELAAEVDAEEEADKVANEMPGDTEADMKAALLPDNRKAA